MAPDEESAKAVEARIWALWASTPSDTASLLMLRAKTAMDGKDYDVAQKLLDAVIRLRPEYIEAWNRRATLFYLQNDYTHSMEDIRQVLIREPRHFGALAGMGMICRKPATTSTRSPPSARRSRSIPISRRCRRW